MQVVKHVLDMYEIHFLKDPLEGGVGSIWVWDSSPVLLILS